MTAYEQVKADLQANPKTWLVTGVAGFIGSNLLETLLILNQRVVGLDNFATGHRHNLVQAIDDAHATPQWKDRPRADLEANFHFIEGDIRDLEACRGAMKFRPSTAAGHGAGQMGDPIPVDYVLHQAALGSVPRSIEDPITTNQANIDGFLNMLVAARDAKVKRFVYAASSSTYGDHPDLPKVEDKIGKPLSPYAVTKLVNEVYSDVFAKVYRFKSIGLRYFNIFGKRQDPDGVYAAVIPKWILAMACNENVYINGDGETSRDFCYINNAIQANLLAATADSVDENSQVYNVAVGNRTSLNQLFEIIQGQLAAYFEYVDKIKPVYRDYRAGDVKHSLADISKSIDHLGYCPSHDIKLGLSEVVGWYADKITSGMKP